MSMTTATKPRFTFQAALRFIFRFQSYFGLIIVTILAVVFSPSRNGRLIFLNERNLSNIFRDVSETGILAVGMLMVILVAGIDLSVGSVLGLAATGSAFLLMRSGWPTLPTVLMVLVIGLIIGWFNGWVSERFNVPSFITTLAMLSIARGLARFWSDNIAVPISYGAGGGDPTFGVLSQRLGGLVPVVSLVMIGVAIVTGIALHYSRFGRYLYAIGGNETAARLSGIRVTRLKIIAFMLCSMLAALAGIVHAAQLNQGSPNAGVTYELNAIAAVVIGGGSLFGGKGTVAGAVAGQRESAR